MGSSVTDRTDVVRRKLGRARVTTETLRAPLDEFDRSITANAQENPWRAIVHHPPFDPDWELLVSDVAHQCRSALDQLVTQLVVANGGEVKQHRGGFPIATTRKDYEGRGKKARSYRDSMLMGVSDAAKLLVDTMQPFHDEKPGAHPLAMLQAISNWDKHKDGHPAVLLPSGLGFYLKSDRQMTITGFEPELFPDGAVELVEGDNILDVWSPARRSAFERVVVEARALDPETQVVLVAKMGIRFGRQRVHFPDLLRIIDYLEQVVLPTLTPHTSE